MKYMKTVVKGTKCEGIFSVVMERQEKGIKIQILKDCGDTTKTVQEHTLTHFNDIKIEKISKIITERVESVVTNKLQARWYFAIMSFFEGER